VLTIKKFKIVVDNQTIYLYIDCVLTANALKTDFLKFTKTIPCEIFYLGDVKNILENQDYVFYKDSDTKFVSIDVEKNVSLLSLPKEKLFFPDIVYLIMCMFANKLQKENKFFMQSSVVANDDTSIMFVGNPNAGKTSLASKLLMTGNWSLVSNDNVLVSMENDKFISLAGTKNIQMRYGGIKRFFPSILSLIPQPEDLHLRDEWDIKVYVDSFFKDFGISTIDKTHITDIYFINTYQASELIIKEKEEIDQLLLIYEQLTKKIRSNRYVLTSFDYPVPSFEDIKYAEMRYQMAKEIVKTTNVSELRGCLDQAVLELRRKHEK